MITGEPIKYLCAMLNSSLSTWYVSTIAVTTGMGLMQWDKFVVESIPIPRLGDAKEQSSFDPLVDDILTALNDSPEIEVAHMQNSIEDLVYEAYEFTRSEVALIRSRRQAKLNSN